MRDKSLSIWLIVLFGIPGLAVLTLAWLWPVLQAERITATIIGAAGLSWAIIQGVALKLSAGRTDTDTAMIKVGAEDAT